MNSTKKDFRSITLTHIINPHMFWFRPESTYYSNENLLALEEALLKHFQNNNILINNRLLFSVGDMVAVFMETWGKWIRVVVDRNIKMLHGKTKCLLWAIDWGFPLQTDVERLRPLPLECAAFESPELYFGGLNYILPSETTYDFTLLKSVESQSKEWSDLVVKEFRKLIDQASNIKFMAEIETEGNHIFGRLEITTHNGIIIDAREVLMQISGVMQIENSKPFLVALQNCNTTKIKRCHNNFNRLSFSDLNYSKVTSYALDLEYKIDNDFVRDLSAVNIALALPPRNVVDKVEEWDRRNCEARSGVGVSECGSEISTVILDDEEGFDSISCYDPLNPLERESRIQQPHVDRVFHYYDEEDEDDGCFVGKCDIVRQHIRKKYQNNKPRSAKIPFELLPKEENSEPSAHIKKIIDKRKKIMENMSISGTSEVPSNESDNVSNVASSKVSYLDKLIEKRERAIKAVETKNTTNKTTVQLPVEHQNPVNTSTKEEFVYGKEEQERRDKLKRSIRGNDRDVVMFPVEYPVSQIAKEIKDNKNFQSSSSKNLQHPKGYQNINKSQHQEHHNSQYPQRQNGKQYFNKQSPQQRLDKYNILNINSNTNFSSDNPSEVESEVW